jgi:hypothetical protein
MGNRSQTPQRHGAEVVDHSAEAWVGGFGLTEDNLPPSLLQKATIRGVEYAWQISDIPEVIEAARLANLLNIGGQLQFRLKDDSTYECYWIDIDTYKTVSSELAWNDRVRLSAQSALDQFEKLKATGDFFKEGRDAFKQLSEADLAQAMCFVWYMSTEDNE